MTMNYDQHFLYISLHRKIYLQISLANVWSASPLLLINVVMHFYTTDHVVVVYLRNQVSSITSDYET